MNNILKIGIILLLVGLASHYVECQANEKMEAAQRKDTLMLIASKLLKAKMDKRLTANSTKTNFIKRNSEDFDDHVDGNDDDSDGDVNNDKKNSKVSFHTLAGRLPVGGKMQFLSIPEEAKQIKSPQGLSIPVMTHQGLISHGSELIPVTIMKTQGNSLPPQANSQSKLTSLGIRLRSVSPGFTYRPSYILGNSPMLRSPVNTINIEICRNQPDGKKIASPLNLNQFLMCYNNQFTLMDCPSHLMFNTFLDRCEASLTIPQSCLSNPCFNNGKCVALTQTQHICECASGFHGANCEFKDDCDSKCGNDGTCLRLGKNGPISHLCLCSNGQFLGFDCNKVLQLNPCVHADSNHRHFSSVSHPAVFLHCQGREPHLKHCHFPLVFSPTKGRCDWN